MPNARALLPAKAEQIDLRFVPVGGVRGFSPSNDATHTDHPSCLPQYHLEGIGGDKAHGETEESTGEAATGATSEYKASRSDTARGRGAARGHRRSNRNGEKPHSGGSNGCIPPIR